MNASRSQLALLITLGLFAGAALPLLAGSKKKKASTPVVKTLPKRAPSKASGLPKATVASAPPIDVSATIQAHRNAEGQEVIVVSPAGFDISPPEAELAKAPGAQLSWVASPEERVEEAGEGALPAKFHHISPFPDPVVQREFPSRDSLMAPGFTPAAPSAPGFNFTGCPNNCNCQPPDTNGTIGFDPATGTSYYVQMVNSQYSIWSLNRATSTPTQVRVPTNINSLFSGFSVAACANNNSGDPVALYDKISNRWFLSQFTANPDASGFYYQCVAVSTTGNPTGTYARYGFAVPNDPARPTVHLFGDYPHWGAWSDGYYMMAHLFDETVTPAAFIASDFGVADRAKMLAGDPSATMQHVIDVSEGGHMPADLDGHAPPPTNAPGIFLSPHANEMWVYRMKVDWATPANTVRTVQAKLKYALYTDACASAATYGQCIPQPGTTAVLDTLSGRLMFRAAYRNFSDHESIMVTHSVDPSIANVESGVRWYEIRLSGNPDTVCNSYPCVYQQSTLAAVGGDTRARWMGSIASDLAGNFLLGYSAEGLANGTDNHSIRYTGRAAGDALNTMTGPEQTIVTATRNQSGARWGDYSSMSVDPFDDCTFWYTTEYMIPKTPTATWSTRIASVRFPAGTGPGQCPATACTARPPAAPTIGTTSVPAPNQVTVSWTALASPPGSYAIERAEGTCGSEGLYQPVGYTDGANTSFTDTTVQGGHTYSYRVTAAQDTLGRCQATTFSGCVSATATGNCVLKPTFSGFANATSADNAACGINVNWNAGTSNCPLGAALKYSVFRSTIPTFTPALANRIATCVSGTTYQDVTGLTPGKTYYYAVRAEDTTTGNGGECGGGNEEANISIGGGTAYGVGLQASPGNWTDDGGDNNAFLTLNVQGGGNTEDIVWRYITNATDAGANHTAGGTYAYRNAGPASSDIYLPLACAELKSPVLTVGAASTNLTFWEKHLIEYKWDGLVIEYSRNGGAWTTVPAPSASTGAGCLGTDVTSDWNDFACTQAPPINGCGYPTTQRAYNGPLASGTACASWTTAASITAYAHRCHPITGLTSGDTIQFRWRFASDPGLQLRGFYLDDIAVSNIMLPNACASCPNGSAPAMTTQLMGKSGGNLTHTWSAASTAADYFTYSAGNPAGGWTLRNTTVGNSWNNGNDLGNPVSQFYTTTAYNCFGESPK